MAVIEKWGKGYAVRISELLMEKSDLSISDPIDIEVKKEPLSLSLRI